MEQNRRTGRTTKILKYMLKTSFDAAFFISKTQHMSKYHRDMLIGILEDRHSSYEVRLSDNVIKFKGKLFYFVGEDTDLVLRTKGLPAVDIYRDHTVFDYSEEV